MILITGGNGLVGSFIIRQLLKDSKQVKALVRANSDLSLIEDLLPQIELVEGDILDFPLLTQLLEGIDTVVHSAAVVSFVPNEEKQMFKVNVEGTTNIVNACLQSGVKKLCYISSVAALGRKKSQPIIDEDAKWENSDLNTNYARTKYLAELEVWRGTEEGLDAVIVNPSVVLGPGDWAKSSVRLFKYIWNQNLFYTKGHLNFVDVRDVAKAVSLLIDSSIANQRFILNGGMISYKEFFEKIAKAFNRKAPSVAVNPVIAGIAWRLEKFRSFITGKQPLITRETANISGKSHTYNSASIQKATGLKFTPIDESIYWTCKVLKEKYTLKS